MSEREEGYAMRKREKDMIEDGRCRPWNQGNL